MKKLKLFPKITLYTFFITLFVMLMAHLFLYLLAPQMILSSDQFKENGAFIISSMNMGMLIKAAIIKAFPISLLCCTVISFLCSILFSKAMTSPIRKICQTTKEMEKMDECSQCQIQSNDEIGELANHVNTLYRSLLMSIRKLEEEKEKVSEAEKSKIDFLRVASHELKTPVTALHAMIENMILQIGRYKNRDECLMECKELTEQLANMIQEVLNTSNLDFSHEGQEATHYDLSMEIMNICEPYQLIAKTKHRYLRSIYMKRVLFFSLKKT